MRAIRQRFRGKIFEHGDQLAVWLHLDDEPIEGVETEEFYLRYALIVMGPEWHVFPALVLDDWGNEVRKLKLYRWIRENGEMYPRAEVFGFRRDGSETQHFLRELELYFKYPLYLFPEKETPIAEGKLVTAVLISDSAVDALTAMRPAGLKTPLRRAAVDWWQIPPSHINEFDLTTL